MAVTERFTIIPDERNALGIKAGMVIPRADVATAHSLIAIQIFALFAFGVLREIVFCNPIKAVTSLIER
jgi:hypothetical protein